MAYQQMVFRFKNSNEYEYYFLGEFGAKGEKRAKRRKKTKEEIAKLLDITPRTAYAYLVGERTPSKRVMKLIKERLNIDPFELLPESQKDPSNKFLRK